MKIKIGFKSRKIKIEVKKLSCLNYFLGLMFKTRNSPNLLFDLPGKWGIHSFFVFFSFLALWVDEKNNVLGWKIVKPFSFHVSPGKKFAKLIEIPLNKQNKSIISIFPSERRKV